MSSSGLILSTARKLIQVANPSFSQSWSHQARDTRLPNHCQAIK